MPELDDCTTGSPCWVDLMTSDRDATTAFYRELFGWTIDDPGEDYGGYVNFVKNGRPVAGCMQHDGQSGPSDIWSVYLATDDAQATADAASVNGGEILLAPMQVMDLGTMAVFDDAGHATVGVWQPGVHRGFGLVAEPGAPAWFELHARDYEASLSFYRDVFGCDLQTMSDTPDFRYTTIGHGDDQTAGIMDASALLADGVPAHWSVYFGVDDADASLVRIAELGGVVVLPAEDTPYGRVAQAADPAGATFNIVAGGPDPGAA
jgi:predicted enzyme related to lactoylglutathione lyase